MASSSDITTHLMRLSISNNEPASSCSFRPSWQQHRH
jgi:hypothetical protein